MNKLVQSPTNSIQSNNNCIKNKWASLDYEFYAIQL